MKFYKSGIYNNIDGTAEPQYKIIAGSGAVETDSLGGDIAADAVVPDLADGHAAKRVKFVYTSDTTIPSFLSEFTARRDVNFHAFLGHTARECFPDPLSRSLSSQAPNGATQTPTYTASGFLGKGRPHLGFDGVDDEVTIDNSGIANLQNGASLEAIVRFSALGATEVIIASTTGSSDRMVLAINTAGFVGGQVYNGSSVGLASSSETTIVANVWYHLVYTYDGSTGLIYVDGVLQSGTSTVGGTNATAGFNLAVRTDDSANNLNGDLKHATPYNRALAPKEIEQHYNYPSGGAPTPIGTVGANSDFHSTNDWSNGTCATFDNSGDLTITSSAGGQWCRLSESVTPMTSGVNYRLSFDVSGVDSQGWSVRDHDSSQTFITVTDADNGTTVSTDFVFASAASGGLRFRAVGSSGTGSFDNVYLTDLDTLTTFPLAADKWGSQTQLVTNGDFSAWTGDDPDSWTVFNEGGSNEISEVGAGEAHGGSGTGYCNINSDGTLVYMHSSTVAVVSGAQYWLRLNVDTVTSGGIAVKDEGGSSMFGTDTYTTSGFKDVYFTATATTNIKIEVNRSGACDVTIGAFELYKLGAVAHYAPDGINKDDGKWYDASDNVLDGTITGAQYNDTPNGTDEEFTLVEYTEVSGAVSVAHTLNAAVITGDGSLYLGQVMAGKAFTPTHPDLPLGEPVDRSGTRLYRSDGGQESAEVRYKDLARWDASWSFLSKSDKANWDEFLDGSKEFPFLFTPDERLDGGLEPLYYLCKIKDYTFAQTAFEYWSLSLTIEEII